MRLLPPSLRWPVLLPTAVCLGALAACDAATPEPPPVIADAPAFQLVDQRGEAFGDADLDGRVWVADFIFTRCQGFCPRLSSRMAEIQEELRSQPAWQDLRLVSISVDPEHDRPSVLADYAQRYAADPEHWIFLTGEREQIWKLSREGFKLPVGENPGDVGEPLFHSGRFVLVDRKGRIRGYYEALEEDGRRALVDAVRALAGAPVSS
jgi:protein SCO1/2